MNIFAFEGERNRLNVPDDFNAAFMELNFVVCAEILGGIFSDGIMAETIN